SSCRHCFDARAGSYVPAPGPRLNPAPSVTSSPVRHRAWCRRTKTDDAVGSPSPHWSARKARSSMTQPLDDPRDAAPPGGPGVLVSLGRSDTELYGPLRDWMAAADLLSNTLQAGADAPEFFLPDERARLISLSGLLTKGPVVLLFIPGSWCLFCISKIRA